MGSLFDCPRLLFHGSGGGVVTYHTGGISAGRSYHTHGRSDYHRMNFTGL